MNFYLQWFFNFFQLNTIYQYIDYTTFTVIFYGCVFIVVLVILDIIYVSYRYEINKSLQNYSIQKKKFRWLWPLKALRSVVVIMVTVMFLNIFETFFYFLRCQPSSNDPTITVLSLFPNI